MIKKFPCNKTLKLASLEEATLSTNFCGQNKVLHNPPEYTPLHNLDKNKLHEAQTQETIMMLST